MEGGARREVAEGGVDANTVVAFYFIFVNFISNHESHRIAY